MNKDIIKLNELHRNFVPFDSLNIGDKLIYDIEWGECLVWKKVGERAIESCERDSTVGYLLFDPENPQVYPLYVGGSNGY